MEFKEYRAKTVNDAITDALIELETTSDKIEYEVIEEGSAGLLGLFSRDAVIRVRKKEIVEDNWKKELEETVKNEQPVKPEVPKTAKKAAEKAVEKTEKQPVKPAKKAEPKRENPVREEEKRPEPKQKPASAPLEIDEAKIKEVLQVIFSKMDIKADVQINVDHEEKAVNIDITGDDTGDIIGKRGQTLDAIQYLISIIINKKQDEYYRVKLDTNNYRERRQKTLENLAKNVAAKVKKTRKKVALEPMNPYERRVIHSYLQSDKYVTTKSEGEEPNRRVVVYYKKS